MYATLSFGEISVYFISWTTGISYSVYKLWEATEYMNPNKFKNYEVGWSVAAKLNEISDYEWHAWIPFLLFKIPWLVSHFVGAELVRRNNIELLPVWHILISSIFLLNFLGAFITGLILLQLAVIYVLMFLRSRIILWIVCGFVLLGYQSADLVDVLMLERTECYLMVVSCSWGLLRSLSFCLDALNTPPSTRCHPLPVDFVLYLSYCLYLPVLFLGPLLIYSEYQAGLKQSFKKWTFARVVCALLRIMRYIFWGLVIDVCLHYLHFVTLVMIPKKVLMLGNWALYGYGYTLGQFFMTKYVVIYGIGITVARLDQIEAPDHPKCIARIHLYSYMWRHFDRGLYNFLLKYIYIPCRGLSSNYWNKLFASFMCFVFVYVWHSVQIATLIWTLLNFIGVTLEGLGKKISSIPTYRKWEDSVLTPRGIRRFHGLLSTPIFMMSALSNFYFLGSYSIGYIFLSRLLSDSFQHNLYLFLFCYCCCQVCMEVNNWEQKQMHARKQKHL